MIDHCLTRNAPSPPILPNIGGADGADLVGPENPTLATCSYSSAPYQFCYIVPVARSVAGYAPAHIFVTKLEVQVNKAFMFV